MYYQEKINLGLHVWVKCGSSSAATSAFYIFKIRTSADQQICILPLAEFLCRIVRVAHATYVKPVQCCMGKKFHI